MANTQLPTAVNKIEGLDKIPNLLMTLTARKDKLKNYAVILAGKVKQGMSPELDSKLQEFIVAAKTAKKDFNDQRSPFTKQFDLIKKEFTALENSIQSEIDPIQEVRNNYAKQLADEADKKRREAELEQNKIQEAITLKADIELEIKEYVQSKIDNLKNAIINSLSTVTVDNQSEKKPKLQAMPTAMNPKVLNEFTTSKTSRFGLDPQNIYIELLPGLEAELKDHYQREIETAKQDAIIQFDRIVAMSKDEKEAALKAAEDQQKLDSQSYMDVATASVQATASAEKAQEAFKSTMEVHQELPENRTGYEIMLNGKEGYAAIAAYWFATCAADYTGKMESKTLGSMVKDLQKHAHKHDVFLENPAVKYEKTYKAVNRK